VTCNALAAQVPYGDTITYGELSRQLGGSFTSTTAQQVGAAVGGNPLCIIVPCHRVLGANGKLTGYAGGIGRKRRLLELEREQVCLHDPAGEHPGGNLGHPGSKRRVKAGSTPITFRPDGAQPYDDRCLSWQLDRADRIDLDPFGAAARRAVRLLR
jgi:O-6-methylguanine DNA methyltransferase